VISLPPNNIPINQPRRYIIQAGDTLTKIAALFHTTIVAILSANSIITDPNKIYANQIITIPQ
jgi:LysM repeat protein